MSESNNKAAEELDLFFFFSEIKKVFKGWVRAFFKGFDFALRRWIIILILILVGLGLGYYLQQNSFTGNKAKILLKVNFEMGNYLYNTVNVIDKKLKAGDTEFYEVLGLNPNNPAIRGVELTPVINVHDITDDFEDTNRNLDALLRYVEFNMEEEELYQTFTTNYNYHYLAVSLTSQGKNEDLQRLMDYINSNPILREYRDTSVKTINEKLEANKHTIEQIEMFMAEYLKREATQKEPSAQFYVERETRPDLLLETKNELLTENQELQDALVFYKDPILALGGVEVYPKEQGILDKKMVILPILLVFGFLFIAYMRYLYFYLRRIAAAPEQ